MGYSVRIIKDSSGERVPFLLKDGLPVLQANLWRLLMRRGRCQSSTLGRELLEVSYLYRWADEKGIDLVARMDSGMGIPLSDSTDFREYLRRKRKADDGIVSAAVEQQRFGTVRHFLEWWMDTVLEGGGSVGKELSDRRYARIRDQRDRMSSWLVGPPADTSTKQGLPPDLREKFLRVIQPNNPANPWRQAVRLRNYVLFGFAIWLGLRLSELLLLKVHHLDIGSREPTVLIERNPDDPEETRLNAPLAKTLGRRVRIPQEMERLVRQYLRRSRPSMGSSTRHPFLFVAQGSGRALSKRAVQHAIEQFVALHPEFRGHLTPHILRHSWSDMMRSYLSSESKKRAIDPEFAKLLFNYLGGWTHGSEQSSRYSSGEIRRAADEVLIAAHSALFSAHAE